MADVALYRVAGRQYRLAGRDRELAESRDPARLRSSSAAGRGGGGAGGPRHLEEADEEGGDEVDASFVKDHPGGGHSVKLAADPEAGQPPPTAPLPLAQPLCSAYQGFAATPPSMRAALRVHHWEAGGQQEPHRAGNRNQDHDPKVISPPPLLLPRGAVGWGGEDGW